MSLHKLYKIKFLKPRRTGWGRTEYTESFEFIEFKSHFDAHSWAKEYRGKYFVSAEEATPDEIELSRRLNGT